jgi:hypothetical protein
MPVMRENAVSPIGKALTVACVIACAALAAANIWRGEVPRPWLFSVALFGCLLFVVAKASIISPKRWISFGTSGMSPGMANAYRAGYWLMCVGTLATFA